MELQDQILTCKDCGKQFTFTVSEQEFYNSKGFTNPPSRCPDCRKEWKKKKQQMGGGGSYSRGNNSDRPMFDAVCSNCGNPCKVPFQPRGDRPVLCNDCFQKQRAERPDRR